MGDHSIGGQPVAEEMSSAQSARLKEPYHEQVVESAEHDTQASVPECQRFRDRVRRVLVTRVSLSQSTRAICKQPHWRLAPEQLQSLRNHYRMSVATPDRHLGSTWM